MSPVPPLQTTPSDPPAAVALRARLLERLRSHDRVHDPRVLDVLETTPRHWFCDVPLADAYRDRPEPIGCGQTISQPTVVGIMTEALALCGDERVLEIGTGSGYQAAILSQLAREVFTIELLAPLGERARERLAAGGFRNVRVGIGDGYLGWPEEAPFDRVIVTAAPPEIPPALLAQLGPGGILVAPVGAGHEQFLERWARTATGLKHEALGPVLFVPMVHGPPR